MDEELYHCLCDHLFPEDGDEHGAVIAAGIVETPRGTRLLAREVFPARDGVDYVPSPRAYRMLTAQFVAEHAEYCASERLCYLAVHNHGGGDTVGFSGPDVASHHRAYPALLDITNDGPVGWLVFATNAVAGEIWTRNGPQALQFARVIGPRVRTLYPSPIGRPRAADPQYDRHTRLFGDVGQEILAGMKVGIIGLGGGGSLLNEWLARLGVGHIVGIDFDRVDLTNLPRVVGATPWDARSLLTRRSAPWLQRLGKRFAAYKVDVARRVARAGRPGMRYDAIKGDVLDASTAGLLRDADFVFLATDSIQSRLVFNALVHQYLIPGAQVGAKVRREAGMVSPHGTFAATRIVLPSPGKGCLECHELIPPGRLQEEALTDRERRAQRYVDDDAVHEPSVITLNALGAAQAANDLMMMFTGLYTPETTLYHQLNFVCCRELSPVEYRRQSRCPDCGTAHHSRRARGDRARLPCRA